MKEIRLLTANDIDVKVKQVSEKGAVLLLYKNARVDMTILDETYGLQNWECDYKEIKGNLYCGIGVRESEDKPFVWKWDCGIESREDDGNEKKGEASDAFKRAGFKWGIGRELYTAPFTFANVPTTQSNGNWKLANPYERFKVKEIEFIARAITKLVIVDSKGNTVYSLIPQNPLAQSTKQPTTTNNSTEPQNTPKTSEKTNLFCTECNAEVSDKVAMYSNSKLGRILCYECQKTFKNKEVEVEPVLTPVADDDSSLPF